MNSASERFEIVADAGRLAAVGPAWMGLWARTSALVFQSHAWISAWWAAAPDRDKRRLRIVLAWHGDDLVAVLPLATNLRGRIRVLEWAAKDCTDYPDALVSPEENREVVRRMWTHVSSKGGFDLAYLGHLLPDAAARSLLTVPAHGAVRLTPNRREETSLRVVGPFASGEDWFKAQSKKLRNNYRRGQKQIAEQGSLRFRLLAPGEPLGPVIVRLTALKRQWLDENAFESDLFDSDSDALSKLIQVLEDLGLLRMFVLECDEQIIAISVNFVQAQTMMAFVTAYDAIFERGSPGAVLMIDYIMWSFDNKIDTVDFLCGDEAFKQKFANFSVQLGSMMGARNLVGRAAMAVDFCRKTWQNLRHQDVAPVP